MKIFRLVTQRVLALSAVAVILLMVVVACGSGALSATATPAQSLGVGQQSGEPSTATATAQPSKEPEGERSEEPALQEPTPAPTTISAAEQSVGGEVSDQAPEFQRVTNWINSPPLTMEVLRGQVVLIDFWTYTCVNCIRTFTYLKEWHAKFADKGLKIVGVHTPEFEFEKVTENVSRSAGEYGLGWPIAQDNDYGTWRAYSNRFWPAKYLVDHHGTVRYTHFGEGAYGETEEQIRRLLEEAGADLRGVEISAAEEPKADLRAYTTDPSAQITREIYGGFQRNAAPQGIYVAHPEYYDGPNQNLTYVDYGDHLNQFIYLQGPWLNEFENLRHARETQNYEDYIALKFTATSVNAVIDPAGDEPFDVQVTIDGRPLWTEEAGADLVIADGRSFFTVTSGRMYEVVALPEFGINELTLSSNSPDFAFFAFTFGAYAQGP
jgi:thiol-disulfide isomerase/thioredoxin